MRATARDAAPPTPRSRRDQLLALLTVGDPDTPLVQRVCEVSATLLGVTGAGMCLVGGRSHQIVVHGTTALAAELEDLQLELAQGPCLQAVRTASPTLVDDLPGHRTVSWPLFAEHALARGVRALFSFPLEAGVVTFGALDLHRDTAGPFTGRQLIDALALTAIATQAMLTQQDREYPDGSVGALRWLSTSRAASAADVDEGSLSRGRSVHLGTTVGQALHSPPTGDDGDDSGDVDDQDGVDVDVADDDGDARPSTVHAEGVRQADRAAVQQARRQVLVVDDEDGMRLVLGRALSRLGYQVVLAETMHAGVAKLAANPDLDAVVVDITMPTEVGLRFAGAVIEYHPGVPILFLTGGPTADGVLDDPLVALVPKPVRIDELRSQLAELIDRADQTATSGRTPATPAQLTAAGDRAVIGHRGRRIEPGGRLRLLEELDPVTATWAAVSGLAGLEPMSAVPGAEESTRLANLGLFAAGVANEVNNMLAVVTMRADLLREGSGGAPPTPAVEEDATAIAGAAARASTLAQQLMLFAGQRTLDRGPVDVAALVEDLRGRLDEIAGGPGVIGCTVEPVADVIADHEHLERIIQNLVRNALEATASPASPDASGPQPPRVRIRVAPAPTGLATDDGPFRQAPGWAPGRSALGVVIEVADSGPGMTDQVRARAVEPFFRAYASAGGSGLGLSTVWGLVSQHGGRLDIDSAPGQGTTVRVTLPAAVPEAAGGTGPTAGRAGDRG